MEIDKKEYEITTKLLDNAYKNVRMASFAIDCIIDKIKDSKLEELLRKQNDFYLDTTEELEKLSEELKHKPSDVNIFLKGSSFASIKMKSMLNDETQHLAEMLTQGTTMGITEMIKSKSDYPSKNEKLLKICNLITGSEEKFVESLKDFL
ncbi:MAG: hypothetical protein ACI4PF_00555 [Christensenellales bacterium]